MHFEIVHEFDIPLDALELAFVSPDLAEKLAPRLTSISELVQRRHALEDKRLERTWAYRANVRLPKFALGYVTQEMLAWDEETEYVMNEHAAKWTILPRVKPEWQKYFSGHGTYELASLGAGRSKRVVRGEIDLNVRVVRQVAEKLIVGEVKKTFEAEAETLREMATLA